MQGSINANLQTLAINIRPSSSASDFVSDLLHVSGSTKQLLKTLEVYNLQQNLLGGQPLQICHGDCLVLTLTKCAL